MNRTETKDHFDYLFPDLLDEEIMQSLDGGIIPGISTTCSSPDWLQDLNLLPYLDQGDSCIVLTAASASTSEPETDPLKTKKTRSVRQKRTRKGSDDIFVADTNVEARVSKLADDKLKKRREKNRKAAQVSRNKKKEITQSLENQVKDLEARLEEAELEKERMKEEIIAFRQQINQLLSNFIIQ